MKALRKPTYKIVKITSQSGLVFELHRGVAIELNSYSPYIFERNRANRAILGYNATLPYNIGTSELLEEPAPVTIEADSIKFGCQVWTGQDAKKLRKWAVSF